MLDNVIDISHFQGSPDFAQVKGCGIAAVIHKGTQGLHSTDSTYGTTKSAAVGEGLLWGAYHFGTGDGTGAQQAQFFLDTIKPASNELVSIDFEPNPSGTTMSLTQLLDWITTVHQALGRWPVVYGGKSLLFGEVGSATNDTLANCPLWVAQYTSAAQPSSIPTQIWPTWTLWQYSESGQIPGISTNVDRDRYNGTDLTSKWPL